jgi:hypothetical protein
VGVFNQPDKNIEDLKTWTEVHHQIKGKLVSAFRGSKGNPGSKEAKIT